MKKDVTRTNVTRTYVTRTHVTRANVTRTNVTRTNVTRTNITRINVTRTNVTRTNVTRVNVTKTKVAGVNIQTTLDHLNLEDLGYMQRFSFLVGHQEIMKKAKRWAAGGWGVGGVMKIMPRCGSILQAGPCQIPSLAENRRSSRVWQYHN